MKKITKNTIALMGLGLIAVAPLAMPAAAQTDEKLPSNVVKNIIRDIENLTSRPNLLGDHRNNPSLTTTSSQEDDENQLFEDEMDEETDGQTGQPATEERLDWTSSLLWDESDDHVWMANHHADVAKHEHESAQKWRDLAKETRDYANTLTDPNAKASFMADADQFDKEANELDGWGNDDDQRYNDDMNAAEDAAQEAIDNQANIDRQQREWDEQQRQRAAEKAAAEEAQRLAAQQAAAQAAAAQAAAEAQAQQQAQAQAQQQADEQAQQQAQQDWNQAGSNGVAPVTGGSTTGGGTTGTTTGGGTNPPTGGDDFHPYQDLAKGQALDLLGKLKSEGALTAGGKALGEGTAVTGAIDMINFGIEAQNVVDEGSGQRASVEAMIDDLTDPRSKRRWDGKNNRIWKITKSNGVRLIQAAPWTKQ